MILTFYIMKVMMITQNYFIFLHKLDVNLCIKYSKRFNRFSQKLHSDVLKYPQISPNTKHLHIFLSRHMNDQKILFFI